jgi:Ala-tRNA(Pro) deacylase
MPGMGAMCFVALLIYELMTNSRRACPGPGMRKDIRMSTESQGEAAGPEPPSPAGGETYAALIALLDRHAAQYRLIDHASEGRTELVSALRGHPAAQAAKCIILIAKLGKKTTRFVLAVVPGDARVDVNRIKELLRATYVGFAATEVAERLAGCVAGTVLPFAFHPELELIADASLLEHETIYFNTARLDRSMALRTLDYVAIARPRIEAIAMATAP